MASKLMSPSKPPAWSSPRKPVLSQEIGNDHRPHDSNTDSSSTLSLLPRAPLCPIPLPSQVGEGMEAANWLHSKGKSEISTPRGRSKLHFQGHEGIENPDQPRKPEVLTPRGKSKLHQQQTPDKQTIPRNRFGWNQSAANTGREATTSGEEVQTPSKLARSSSAREFCKEIVSADAIECQAFANPSQSNFNRVGTSNHSTPRSIRNTKNLSNESEVASIAQGVGTPNRNVSRTLKYNSSSGSGNGNLGRPGNLSVRSANTMSQALRSDSQQVDVPYFDLEEDPSFWKDHNVQVHICSLLFTWCLC